jgi:hypothetical protein
MVLKMFKKILTFLIGGPVVGAAGILGEFVQDWRQDKQNKRDLKKAASEFRQEQARSKQSYLHEWELRALEGRDIWVRRIVLAVFMWPLVWAYFDPQAVHTYFNETLKVLPSWYQQALLSMLAVVWGLSELRNMRAGKGAKPRAEE